MCDLNSDTRYDYFVLTLLFVYSTHYSRLCNVSQPPIPTPEPCCGYKALNGTGYCAPKKDLYLDFGVINAIRETPWTKAECEAVCKQYETYPTYLGFEVDIGSNNFTDRDGFFCSCVFPGGEAPIAPPNFESTAGDNNTGTEMVADGNPNATCYEFSCKDNCPSGDAVSVLVMNRFC